MEKIYFGKKLIALRIKKIIYGSIPQTDQDAPLQLVTLKHSKGTHIAAHMHIPKRRVTQRLQECLMVRRGRVKIDLYSPGKRFFKYIYLKSGEALLIVNGGLGVHMLEDSELIELKNGPFLEDRINIKHE